MAETDQERSVIRVPESVIPVLHCVSSEGRFAVLSLLTGVETGLSFQKIRKELSEGADKILPSATVTNYLNSLTKHGLVESVHRGQYNATDFGRTAHQGVLEFSAQVEPLDREVHTQSIVDSLDLAELQLLIQKAKERLSRPDTEAKS